MNILQPLACAIIDKARHGAASIMKMCQQIVEIWQVRRIDPVFVQCEDETRPIRFEKIIAVFDAFGDAFERDKLSHVIAHQQFRCRLGADLCVNCHQAGSAAAASSRGSLKVMLSSAVTT